MFFSQILSLCAMRGTPENLPKKIIEKKKKKKKKKTHLKVNLWRPTLRKDLSRIELHD